jgi:hypothetical protein
LVVDAACYQPFNTIGVKLRQWPVPVVPVVLAGTGDKGVVRSAASTGLCVRRSGGLLYAIAMSDRSMHAFFNPLHLLIFLFFLSFAFIYIFSFVLPM